MSGETYITFERLAYTADGRLVHYTDIDAAFLAYRPGDPVPLELAHQAGLVPIDKAAEPQEDKMVRPQEDKASLAVAQGAGDENNLRVAQRAENENSLEVARPAEGEVALAVAQPAPRGRKRKNR